MLSCISLEIYQKEYTYDSRTTERQKKEKRYSLSRMFKDVVLPICCLGLLGQSFSTHSRILFSSENFLYKIFITKNAQKTKMTNSRRTSRGPAVEKHCSKQIQLTILSALLTFFSTALFNNRHYAVGYQRHTQRIALLATACN